MNFYRVIRRAGHLTIVWDRVLIYSYNSSNIKTKKLRNVPRERALCNL